MRNNARTVLCVDDDQDFLDSMKVLIEGGGYTFEAAKNARDGLKKYNESKPDIVLVDLMMEDIDSGISLVNDIRALGAAPPIYMLSSVGDNLQDSTDCAQLGLSGVLQKPIKPNVLSAILKARLNMNK